MKNIIVRWGVFVFFAAVIVVSLVLMNRSEPETVETVNTMPEEYRVQTDIIMEETDPSGYGHDIDFETAPTENADEKTDGTAETEPPQEEVSEDTQTSASSVSRTVITSRQRKEYDKNSVYIDMENILQNPELPVGCEITSLTMLLRFYGFDAEKTDLARNYLPVSWGNPVTKDGKLYKDSFFDYFIGDPFSRGYGCFSPAIEKAAVKYISAHGGGYTVKNISGCHPDTLYEYIIAGTPVLCWATDGMIEPEYYETWYDNATGQQLDWYLNEHCFVLAGFNIANSTVTLNDPMKGIIDYNIDKFEVRFKQMYSQAIVIIPDGEERVTAAETSVPVTAEDMQTETETASALPEESAYETETSVTVAGSEKSSDTESMSETFSEYLFPTETEPVDTDFFTGSFIYE